MYSPDRLHDLLGKADYVVLALPGTSETSRVIDAAALAAMKPSAVIVNIGRGTSIDQSALIAGDTMLARHCWLRYPWRARLAGMSCAGSIVCIGMSNSLWSVLHHSSRHCLVHAALDAKQIRGAALDVFEQEPLSADSPLWDMDSVLVRSGLKCTCVCIHTACAALTYKSH